MCNRFDMPYHEIVYEDKGKMKKWNPAGKKTKHVVNICSKNTHASSNSPSKTTNQHSNQPPNQHPAMDAGFLFHLQELKEFLLMEKSMQV